MRDLSPKLSTWPLEVYRMLLSLPVLLIVDLIVG